MITAEEIRRMRTAAGLTQTQLGEILGVAKNTVSRWERGECRPRMEYVAALLRMRREVRK